MKHRRVLSWVLIVVLVVAVFLPSQAAATESQDVTNKLNNYISFLSSYGVAYWNGKRGAGEAGLKNAVDRGDYSFGLTKTPCPYTYVDGHYTHNHDYGCTSNIFGNAAQCLGFAKYLCYVLYGSYPVKAGGDRVTADNGTYDGWTYYTGNTSYPGLKVGDMIRYYYTSYGTHAAIVYSVSANGVITVVDCNEQKKPCIVHKHELWGVKECLTESVFKSFYESNKAYICRYGSNTVTNTIPNVMSVATNSATNITKSDAQLNGSCSYSGTRPSSVGVYLGTSQGSMKFVASDNITFSKNPFSMWYNVSKYGVTLSPGTTYYYQCYAIVNDKTTWSDVQTFTTLPSTDSGITLSDSSITLSANTCEMINATTNPSGQTVTWSSSDPSVATVDSSGMITTGSKGGTATITASMTYNGTTVTKTCLVTVKTDGSVTLSVSGVSSVAQTTARVDATCSYTGTRPSTVGVYLGISQSNMNVYGSDTINHNKNPFNIWYNLSGLSAHTTYYYKFYAIVNNKEYTSEVSSFTTAAATDSEPTYTAYVVNTNGQYLAINDAPAASPSNSNQIGRIPPGGAVTVYPNKASGNWQYVSYNGVSGYAYGKYLG